MDTLESLKLEEICTVVSLQFAEKSEAYAINEECDWKEPVERAQEHCLLFLPLNTIKEFVLCRAKACTTSAAANKGKVYRSSNAHGIHLMSKL